jgi:hypothetical protein
VYSALQYISMITLIFFPVDLIVQPETSLFRTKFKVTHKKIKEFGDLESQPMSDFNWNISYIINIYVRLTFLSLGSGWWLSHFPIFY